MLTVTRVVPEVKSLSARALLTIGAASSCAAMVLACLYPYNIAARVVILRIPTMATSHGLLNGFGFAAASLLAWSRITANEWDN